jgi:copper chaperone NosL
MRTLRLLGALLLAFVMAACGTGSADGPPDINYGRDICVQCNMIISEIGHAAAYRLDDGEEKVFDGIGEMVLHGREQDEFSRAEAWIHDYRSEEWVKAEDAFYVPTRSVSSPMGHGVFGFSDQQRAYEFATEVGGEVIDWATVLQIPIADGLVGGEHGHGDGTHDMKEDDMDEQEMEGDT